MAVSNAKRNLFAFGGIYLFALILSLLSPPAFLKEAQLTCPGSGVVAKFPDMDACGKAPKFRDGECPCIRVQNEWHRPYMLSAVPLLTTLLAYTLLRGSLLTRLILLNVAFTAVVVTGFVYSLVENAAAALYTVPGLLVGVPVHWLAMSLAFTLIMLVHKRFTRPDVKGTA